MSQTQHRRFHRRGSNETDLRFVFWPYCSCRPDLCIRQTITYSKSTHVTPTVLFQEGWDMDNTTGNIVLWVLWLQISQYLTLILLPVALFVARAGTLSSLRSAASTARYGKCPPTAWVFRLSLQATEPTLQGGAFIAAIQKALTAREASRQRPFCQFSFSGENPPCLRLTWKRGSASKSVENFYYRYVFPECKGVLLSITTGSTSANVQRREGEPWF
jgi:hypothetical protein